MSIGSTGTIPLDYNESGMGVPRAAGRLERQPSISSTGSEYEGQRTPRISGRVPLERQATREDVGSTGTLTRESTAQDLVTLSRSSSYQQSFSSLFSSQPSFNEANGGQQGGRALSRQATLQGISAEQGGALQRGESFNTQLRKLFDDDATPAAGTDGSGAELAPPVPAPFPQPQQLIDMLPIWSNSNANDVQWWVCRTDDSMSDEVIILLSHGNPVLFGADALRPSKSTRSSSKTR